jgi:flagellar FliJ protein
MPFRFSLAAVLRLRQTVEERDKLALEQIQHEIVQLTQLLEQIDVEKNKDAQTRQQELTSGIPAAHVVAVEADRQRLEQTQKQLQQQLVELRAVREKRLLLYQDSRRKREVMSELRSQQWETYETEESRRQQKVLDDIFLSRLPR